MYEAGQRKERDFKNLPKLIQNQVTKENIVDLRWEFLKSSKKLSCKKQKARLTIEQGGG